MTERRPRTPPDDRPAPVLPPGGGLLLVDKPSGCTSHDVVGRLRRVLRTRRIGHAGTLDPMATGLLVLAVDRSTKLLGHLALTDKTYLATIRLGQQTDTDDADGVVVATRPVDGLTESDIRAGIAGLTGPLMQVPSSVSAIKVQGRRAYDLVRSGETVELAARPVTVSRFEILTGPRVVTVPVALLPFADAGDRAVDPRAPADSQTPADPRTPADSQTPSDPRTPVNSQTPADPVTVVDLDVVVDCTTGTYIRSLARDLGASLGVGGHLTRLRRTRVGPFTVEDAVEVFGADAQISTEFADEIAGRVIPASSAVQLAFPTRTVGGEEVEHLRHGRTISASGIAGTYGVLDESGSLVALVSETGSTARSVLGWLTG